MFANRRARKQAELHEELAARLRDTDPEVRSKAAAEAAETDDQEWALRELVRAVEREPWAEDFSGTVVSGFATALRRERPIRERTEQVVAQHLDDPEGFVRAWTSLTAELGGGPAVRDIDDDLRDDMRGRLIAMRREGWTAEGISGRGQPGGFAYDLAFDIAVMLACVVLHQNAPVSDEEAEQLRAETRAVLRNALPYAPGSDERAAALAPLTKSPEVESWTDRARAGVRVDEALDLCTSGEEDLVTLGAELLAKLLFGEVVRLGRVREVLDGLVAREARENPFLLSRILQCYSHLHMPMPLDDPPLPLLLDSLRHPDPVVRAAAAEGLDPMATGSPAEAEAVEGLVGLLENDPDTGVRCRAALALRWLKYDDEHHARIASDALERQADSDEPEIRAHSVADALRRGAPDAYDRLLAGLESPSAHWQLVLAPGNVPGGSGFVLPTRSQRKAIIQRVEALRDSGWADRDITADFTGAERAQLLSDLLDLLRGR
ncbi:HEAT repeat domain-containing protein [Streptomyces sp. NBC_01381]|uniref:HEAT repeat domain-containing protein n=1 Tax=Streptomyces sp. NBC_01381 TaxID=2903845 RepID=UPI0022510950|nr:HEAT repeat domain-containing protein [Streptomyces sp. NBC_01381]MCX4671594.1 HEAT repeat domain-containing protein [Streptomyces sp. NBC_01381]